MEEGVDKHILVRALGLSALGKLDSTTIKLAAQLDIPQHEGADDFVDKDSFQNHLKRVKNRKKRKR
jgi:hypothetical protein